MFLVILLLCSLAGPFAAALTYSEVNPYALPLFNIYDPFLSQNKPITHYSYEELASFLQNPNFRQWNDIPKVCGSMQRMFGHAAPGCGNVYMQNFPPNTMRAYTDYAYSDVDPATYYPGSSEPCRENTIIVPAQQVVMTDPLLPPWGPTYSPYGIGYW
jgi:hypothetical protein